jgi:hypothetical protein
MANKYISKLIVFFACLLFCLGSIEAQEADSAIAIMVKGKDFTYTAVTYSSSSTDKKQLNDYYFIKVTKDSITGSLPYFGNSYTPQINLTDGGIKFTSLKFDYTLVEKKRGKILLTIKPKDERTLIQELFMTIFSNGRTELNVQSRNREPTSFSGYIAQ